VSIAILGCGQLARMMAQAAARLDIVCSFVALKGENTACVDGLGKVVGWSPGDDTAALFTALQQPWVVTVEREAIDVTLLRELESFCRVAPSPESVLVGQNRSRERALLQALDIPCAPHSVATDTAGVRTVVAALGLPLVVKACESGYDGKLQWRFHSRADVDHFCNEHERGQWLIEKFVDFKCEVSIVAARSSGGEFVAYPLTENHHREGILLASIAPARQVSAQLHLAATHYIRTIMDHLGYVGVLAAEFFFVDGCLLMNELAPRVHNSGHWTMQDNITSQFENHVRAILGMPLGATQLQHHAGMMNILGSTEGVGSGVSDNTKARLHLYNKAPAPLRKLGHLNVAASSEDELLWSLNKLHEKLYGETYSALDFSDDALAHEE
jgi:5-(carboxyamino)imidazole ribonucleotide synthase